MNWPDDVVSMTIQATCELLEELPGQVAPLLTDVARKMRDDLFSDILTSVKLIRVISTITDSLRTTDRYSIPISGPLEQRVVLKNPTECAGARSLPVTAPSVPSVGRSIEATAPLASIASGLGGQGEEDFEIPRSIRQAMRDALAHGPLLPNDLVTAVIGMLATEQNMAIPESPADQKKIVEDVGDKIAKTLDGDEFRIELFGDDRNKIRFNPR